jgi:hypothetical protein
MSDKSLAVVNGGAKIRTVDGITFELLADGQIIAHSKTSDKTYRICLDGPSTVDYCGCRGFDARQTCSHIVAARKLAMAALDKWEQIEQMLEEPFERPDAALLALIEETVLVIQEKRDADAKLSLKLAALHTALKERSSKVQN